MTRLGVGGMLLLAAALAAPPAVRADWGVAVGVRIGHDRAPGRGAPAFRYGYDRGWREGSREGHRDGRRCRDPRFWRDHEYRDGDRGYKRWMGPRGDYVAGFRRGYKEGYRRAWAAARHERRDARYRHR